MGPIQIRVFSRLEEFGNLLAAVAAVEGEVNAFLATLDPNDVADVRYETTAIGKYTDHVLVQCVVYYAE